MPPQSSTALVTSQPPAKTPSKFDLGPVNDFDARLAVELAIQLVPVQDLLKRYELTKQELQVKLKDAGFRRQVRDAKRVWNSDLSVKERIRLKSQVLIEDSILAVYNILHDNDTAPQSRLEAFKQLARVADVDQPEKQGADAGSRFSITLQFGDPSQRPLAIEGKSVPVTVSDAEDGA